MDRLKLLRILSLTEDIEAEVDAADDEFIDSYDALYTIREMVRGELNEECSE